jgi:hypothetical protein
MMTKQHIKINYEIQLTHAYDTPVTFDEFTQNFSAQKEDAHLYFKRCYPTYDDTVDIMIMVDSGYDYTELMAVGMRWETNAEFKVRERREESSRKSANKAKAKKEAEELKQYAKLHKKYGAKNV